MDRKFQDSLLDGDSAKGVKLGLGLTSGDFWARCGGCKNVYRGLDSLVNVDVKTILKVSSIDEKEIVMPVWMRHEAKKEYYYLVRNVNGMGEEEQSLGCNVRCVANEDGNIGAGDRRCNAVYELAARQIDAATVEVSWFYSEISQGAAPLRFEIYHGSSDDTVNYNTIAAEVCYSGRRYYRCRIGGLAGISHVFDIMSVDAAGNKHGRSMVRIQMCGN